MDWKEEHSSSRFPPLLSERERESEIERERAMERERERERENIQH
jgi:hypothetical protein